MTAYTATQTGNWSSSSTWGGSGVPGDGDTATIGAFTVTVDVNTTVGTSPNDTTTKVVDKTSATGALVVASGVTLTVKGNIGGVNGSLYQLNAGAAIVFDASGSGGSPVYCFVNVGFVKLDVNGASGNKCSISSVSGRTFTLAQNYSQLDIEHCNITRMAAATITFNSVNANIIGCTFTSCGLVTLSSSGTTLTHTITDNTFTSTTGSGGCLSLQFSGTKTSGSRILKRNIFDTLVTHFSIGLEIEYNVFLGDLTCVATRTWSTNRNNLVIGDSTANGGNGALLTGSVERNYYVNTRSAGNPHFIAPSALLTVDNIVSQCVFESQSPDQTDTGDCVLLNGACCSSTKVVVKNCVVLPSGYSGSTVHSGQLITVYNSSIANNTSSQVQALRNTCNVNQTSVGGVAKRAAIAFAEASAGFADQVSAIKGNIAWCASANDGYLAERISGTVDGIITASGADYNWLYNIATDNNGRGYRDRANSPAQDLWGSGNADGGDAAAAGVDNNQGTGNPQFVDSTRNISAWATARSYGSSYSDGVDAIKANTSRIADLIAYVFEGFKPANASCRNAAHDGLCAGAANYSKTSRRLSTLASTTTALSTKYAV